MTTGYTHEAVNATIKDILAANPSNEGIRTEQIFQRVADELGFRVHMNNLSDAMDLRFTISEELLHLRHAEVIEWLTTRRWKLVDVDE
jgi:hypothetical protein